MIATFWENITTAVSEFIKLLGTIFTQIGGLFFEAKIAESGGATTYTPTFLGLLMFIALAAGLVWVVFGIIRKLMKNTTK